MFPLHHNRAGMVSDIEQQYAADNAVGNAGAITSHRKLNVKNLRVSNLQYRECALDLAFQAQNAKAADVRQKITDRKRRSTN